MKELLQWCQWCLIKNIKTLLKKRGIISVDCKRVQTVCERPEGNKRADHVLSPDYLCKSLCNPPWCLQFFFTKNQRVLSALQVTITNLNNLKWYNYFNHCFPLIFFHILLVKFYCQSTMRSVPIEKLIRSIYFY